jgi:hypothetical protein
MVVQCRLYRHRSGCAAVVMAAALALAAPGARGSVLAAPTHACAAPLQELAAAGSALSAKQAELEAQQARQQELASEVRQLLRERQEARQAAGHEPRALAAPSPGRRSGAGASLEELEELQVGGGSAAMGRWK